jgi:hypothetical protein
MSTATVSRTARKTRNTAASLIASEFATRQPQPPAAIKLTTLSDGSIWDEVVLPAPAESHPAANHATSPVILVLVAFVIVTMLVKVSIAIILIAAKITKKIAHQIAAFWATQMGGEKVDFRIYQAIFD